MNYLAGSTGRTVPTHPPRTNRRFSQPDGNAQTARHTCISGLNSHKYIKSSVRGNPGDKKIRIRRRRSGFRFVLSQGAGIPFIA